MPAASLSPADYADAAAAFVGRLDVTVVRREVPVSDAFSPRARERNGYGASGVNVWWDVQVSLDGAVIEVAEDLNSFGFESGTWFKTRKAAQAFDIRVTLFKLLIQERTAARLGDYVSALTETFLAAA